MLARKPCAPNRSRQADNQTAPVFVRRWSKKPRAIRGAGKELPETPLPPVLLLSFNSAAQSKTARFAPEIVELDARWKLKRPKYEGCTKHQKREGERRI